MRTIILMVVLSLVLTACVPIWQQRPDATPESLWDARQADLLQLKQWKIQGRTVVRQDQEAWNVGLRWQQDNERFSIQLLGPFSQGGVSLEGNDAHVILTMDDGQKVQSADVEELITKTLGVPLPINALRDWVRGIPFQQEKIELIELDDDGKITHLVQQDWNIDFKRYVPFDGRVLPSKIFISQPDRSLRLVITAWQDLK